ncbi:MAG: glycosyltransferase, partial [Candidatus Cloacimonetes bacterium]|nr:glycosyltransferase [Candidatus Cloacimonadota bacterium]
MEQDHNTFKVSLTGGGTLGHIVPGLAVASKLISLGCSVSWIGSKSESEKQFIEKRGIRFYPVSSGKLRRYFSLSNF